MSDGFFKYKLKASEPFVFKVFSRIPHFFIISSRLVLPLLCISKIDFNFILKERQSSLSHTDPSS